MERRPWSVAPRVWNFAAVAVLAIMIPPLSSSVRQAYVLGSKCDDTNAVQTWVNTTEAEMDATLEGAWRNATRYIQSKRAEVSLPEKCKKKPVAKICILLHPKETALYWLLSETDSLLNTTLKDLESLDRQVARGIGIVVASLGMEIGKVRPPIVDVTNGLAIAFAIGVVADGVLLLARRRAPEFPSHILHVLGTFACLVLFVCPLLIWALAHFALGNLPRIVGPCDDGSAELATWGAVAATCGAIALLGELWL